SLTLLFNTPPPTNIYTLSLHDALPIFHGAARETIWRQSDLWEGWLPRRSDRADARAGNGLLRDRRRRSRARDDADRGDRRGRLGGTDARVPLEVPRQGFRAADRRDRRARQLALPRRTGTCQSEAGGTH